MGILIALMKDLNLLQVHLAQSMVNNFKQKLSVEQNIMLLKELVVKV